MKYEVVSRTSCLNVAGEAQAEYSLDTFLSKYKLSDSVKEFLIFPTFDLETKFSFASIIHRWPENCTFMLNLWQSCLI